MPVESGNLLFLGDWARGRDRHAGMLRASPALNGADWVLRPHCCGLDVSGQDISRDGYRGLLNGNPHAPPCRAQGRSREPKRAQAGN